MSDELTSVSDDDFKQKVLDSDLPVLVDFWAQWCHPCKMIAPIIEDIAKEYSGRVKVFKMNVDENSEIPVKYSVRGIPSLLIFQGGNVVATRVGALTKSQLTAYIDDNVS